MGCRLRKSQVAMEFILLIMFAFMIMIVFSVFAKDRTVDLREEEEFAALKDVSLAVQTEIRIASGVEDGYERQFSIPLLLDSSSYNVTITSGYLVAESENHEYVIKVSSVSGNIAKGLNTIRKDSGVIHLNE